MKRGIVLISVIVLSLFLNGLFAQPQGRGQRPQRTPEDAAKSQVDWMTKELSLNQATQTKVYDIVLKYQKKLSDERQKLMAANDREGMRAKMTEINGERDKELKAALGDKTFDLFKKKEAERREAMRQQMGNRPPQGGNR
jgi:hypothetical protein